MKDAVRYGSLTPSIRSRPINRVESSFAEQTRSRRKSVRHLRTPVPVAQEMGPRLGSSEVLQRPLSTHVRKINANARRQSQRPAAGQANSVALRINHTSNACSDRFLTLGLRSEVVSRRQTPSRHVRRPGGPRRVQPLLSHAGYANGIKPTAKLRHVGDRRGADRQASGRNFVAPAVPDGCSGCFLVY